MTRIDDRHYVMSDRNGTRFHLNRDYGGWAVCTATGGPYLWTQTLPQARAWVLAR